MTNAPASDPHDVAPAVADLETIVSLSKRRGFIFPSSEIYGGINAVWDYGPLGVELKNNVKRAWWRAMVQERDDIVGLDAGILMHPQVWVTSGHVGSLQRPAGRVRDRPRRFRLDELPGAEDLTATELRDPGIVERLGLRCPVDGGPLSAPRRFNLMFKTFMGPVEEDASVIYLRPETAQGSYVNFKNVQQSSRKKLPFGIAQIGKSFRNEISPGNFVFRMREFEQMEMQYFVRPGGRGRRRVRGLAAASDGPGTSATASRRRGCACASTPPTSWPTTRRRRSTSSTASRSAGRSSRAIHNRGDFDLSRHARGSRREPRVLRPGDRRARHPVDRRDRGRRGPGGVHVPDRRLPRGGGPRRDAGLAGPPPRPRAVQGRGAAAAQEAARDRRAVPPDQGRPAAPHDGRLRRHGRDRQALPAPGRDRHAVVRDRRRRFARGRRGHRARPRLDGPGAGAGRRRDAPDPRPARRGARRMADDRWARRDRAAGSARRPAWLDALEPGQRAGRPSTRSTSPERFAWEYTPGPARGLAARRHDRARSGRRRWPSSTPR